MIAGLALSGLGYRWGDAAAAIGVAVVISALGLRLARSTVETLLDQAPAGASETASAAIRRCRASSISNACASAWSARPISSTPSSRCPAPSRSTASNRSSSSAQSAVAKALGDADLTFTAVPVARDNESIRERIMVIARNSGLAVHHVTVHDLGGKLTVSIDLEVDGEMELNAAHAIAHDLEQSIRDEFGDVEADTHIEPLSN